MTNEQRVKTLFAEANPIPDADSFDLDKIGGTAYLATLEQRSSEMVTTKVREKRMRQRGPFWAAAAAVFIVVLVGAMLVTSTRGDVAAPVDDATPPTSQPAPNTTAIRPAPEDLQGFTGNEPPGTYRPALFQPVFAFSVDREGWRPNYGTGRHFSLTPPEEQGLVVEQPVIFFTAPDASTVSGAETVEEVVSYISSHSGLDVDQVESTKFGQLNAQMISGVGTESTIPLWGNGQNIFYETGQDHDYSFYVFEIGGAPIVVTIDYQNAEQRIALAEEVEAILSSIRWAGID